MIPTLQQGQIGRTILLRETFCGLLCHFDNTSGSDILSAVGPNLVPSGTAALSSSTPSPVFGANQGDCGNGDFSADLGVCTLDTNWRVEGRFYFKTDLSGYGHGTLFTLGTAPTAPLISLRSAASGVLSFTYTTPYGFASQLVYGYPVKETWYHIAVQYVCDVGHTDYHKIVWFMDGARMSELIGGGPSDYFGSEYFEFVSVGGNAMVVDEFRFKTSIASADLYGATYTVPTSPFTPAD